MSKQALGWGCAFVALMGLLAVEQLVAQEKTPGVPAAQYYADTAAQRINAALDQRIKTPLNYDSEQLDIVLNGITEEYDIPIVFDKATLEELAISAESEITINLRNISLRSALNHMLREPGLEELCYMVDDEVLLITTEEKRNATLFVRIYRVDDLLASASPQNNTKTQYSEPDHFMDLIVSLVEYDSWRRHEQGEGELRFYPPGMIVVSQTHRVHDKIEELLAKLRLMKQQILSDAAATTTTANPAA